MNAANTLSLVIEAQQNEIDQQGAVIMFLSIAFLSTVLVLCVVILYYNNKKHPNDYTK